MNASKSSHDSIGSGRPAHHDAWVSGCVDIIARSSDLHLVVVGSPQRPVAIAPLVMRPQGGGRLEQLGVRVGLIDAQTVRFVTHKDVDDDGIERAIAALARLREPA